MTQADASGTDAKRTPATPVHSAQAHYHLRGALDPRFAAAQLESAYRAFFLETDKRHAIIAIGVYGLLKASFAVVDVLVQPPAGLSRILFFRFAFVAACAATMALMVRVRRSGQYDALVLGWVLLVVVSSFYTISHRPADHFGFVVTSPIQLLLVFAFFRNRLGLQMQAGLIMVAADCFALLELREPMATPMLVQVALSYAIAFLVGVMVSRQLKLSRRRMYEALAREREFSQAMRELAFRDDLTDVLNRRSFLQHAGAAWEALARGAGGCVLILDIDHFKALNDRHGHDAGDQALVGFARMVQAASREEDLFGRIGGEEFALLLPAMPLADAQRFAESIMAGCRALQVRQVEPLSVSIGIAAIRAADGNLATTMLRADRALYRAKAAGRGRSSTAEEDEMAATG